MPSPLSPANFITTSLITSWSVTVLIVFKNCISKVNTYSNYIFYFSFLHFFQKSIYKIFILGQSAFNFLSALSAAMRCYSSLHRRGRIRCGVSAPIRLLFIIYFSIIVLSLMRCNFFTSHKNNSPKPINKNI